MKLGPTGQTAAAYIVAIANNATLASAGGCWGHCPFLFATDAIAVGFVIVIDTVISLLFSFLVKQVK